MPITTTRLSGLVFSIFLVLTACSSGSSGEDSSIDVFLDSENNTTGLNAPNSLNEENDERAITNFSIGEFTGTSVYTSNRRFEWIATVTNTGNNPGELPDTGLLLESTTSDFSNGSAIAFYTLERTDESEDRELMPGESVEVTGFSTVAGFSSLEGSFDWTDSYVKFWMNPDYGLFTFLNPQDGSGIYESIYLVEEENYDDNITDTILVRKETYFPQESNCFEDEFEENDTIDSATPIALDTEYGIILCEDTFDVFELELEESKTYEVTSGGFDFQNGLNNRLIVIGPDNAFVLDKTGIFGLFRAPMNGIYKIVITTPFGEHHGIDDQGTFMISER